MKYVNLTKTRIETSTKLKIFSKFIVAYYNQLTNEYKGKWDSTINQTTEIIRIILFELNRRNYNNKDKKIPIFIPMSPNKYSTLNPKTWSTLKEFSLTQINLAIHILIYFNLITIEYGYIKLQKRNDDWELLDKCITKIYLNPQSKWKPIFNYKTNKYYNLFDLYCIFYQDKVFNYSPATYSKKILDENNKPIKINGQWKKKHWKADPHTYKDVLIINKYLYENNYPELQYTRRLGETEDCLGRLMASFQQISKQERLECFNEQKLVELDYTNFVPSILYEIATGKKCNRDFYNELLDFFKIPTEYRIIVKNALLLMFSCESKKQAKKAITRLLCKSGLYCKEINSLSKLENIKIQLQSAIKQENEIIKKYNSKKSNKNKKKYLNIDHKYNSKKYIFSKFIKENNFSENLDHFVFNADYLINSIELLFPFFNQFFYSKSSNLTQNLESKIIIQLLKVMIQFNILPLSIHDCIIIPIKYKQYFNKLMIKIKSDIINQYVNTSNNIIINYKKLYKNTTHYIKNNLFQIIYNNKVLKIEEVKNEIVTAPT